MAGRWLAGHGLVLGGIAFLLYLTPASVATSWPGPLPPLAIRFIASLFAGFAAILLIAARGRDPDARRAIPALSLATLIVSLSPWPGASDVASMSGLAVLTVMVVVPAAVDVVTCVPDVRAPGDPRAPLLAAGCAASSRSGLVAARRALRPPVTTSPDRVR